MQLQVKPRTVSEAEVQKSRHDFDGAGAGCSVAFITYVVIAGSINLIDWDLVSKAIPIAEKVYVPMMCGMPILLGFLTSEYSKSWQAKEWQKSESLRRRKEAVQEAERISEQLRGMQVKAVELAKELPRLVRRAEEELNLAEKEFEERVYSPFWDHIAATAEYLAHYQLAVTQLTAIGKNYCGLLENRDHSFPGRISLPAGVTSPNNTLARIRTITRQGQKDFEFAQIWEHHKTRRVLVKGFSTLESALYELGDSLQISLAACASEISMSLVELLDEINSRS